MERHNVRGTMSPMTSAEVLRRRIATQRLRGPGMQRAADVVRLLACVQSQECAHAFWSLGMRTSGLGYADVQAEFNAGLMLRTHILRPTWHLVPAEDIRWILAATSARVQQLNGTMYRREGLGPATLDRGAELICELLRGGQYRTRAELGATLAAEGLVASRFRLAYVIMNAELEGLICSGPMRGGQQTYALLAERAPEVGSRAGDLGELAWRFYAGHGPASLRDLARWATLTQSQAGSATEAASERLERVAVDGVPHWFDPAAASAAATDRALLLPVYDEATLSYPAVNFPRAELYPQAAHPEPSAGAVVVGEANIGTWRRELRGKSVIVDVAVASGRSARDLRLVTAAAEELAAFLGRQLELTIR
jgi:hypothetical protein